MSRKATKNVFRRRAEWSYRKKRGVFLLGLLLAFALAGVVVMSG